MESIKKVKSLECVISKKELKTLYLTTLSDINVLQKSISLLTDKLAGLDIFDEKIYKSREKLNVQLRFKYSELEHYSSYIVKSFLSEN